MREVSVENGDCGMLFDKNGKEIPSCVWADLQFGWVEIVLHDSDGRPIFDERHNRLTFYKCYPAPLRFERNDGASCP